MDFHRADWSEFSDTDDSVWERGFDIELPPEPIGQDERRMQMRAHATWYSLRQADDFPAIAALDMAELADFSDHAARLHFFAIAAVELVAMAVPLGDFGRAIRCPGLRRFAQGAGK